MASQSLTFPAGATESTQRCLSVPIINEYLVEGEETFTVGLAVTTAGVDEGNTTTIVTIIPDGDR